MSTQPAVPAAFVKQLHEVVATCRRPDTLGEAAYLLAEALETAGLSVDRLQLPLSALFGLKHPLYFGIILTWVRGSGSNAWLRPLMDGQEASALKTLAESPFGPLLSSDTPHVHYRVGTKAWASQPRLKQLEVDGFVEYFAMTTTLPDGARQVVSIATRSDAGFPDDVQQRLQTLSVPLGLALYAVYQAQLAHQVAHTYLGQRTGSLVLEGVMGRGRSASLNAGIAFLDIREFTSLSHALGVKNMVPLLNAVFETIDEAIRPLGGEILKLIGDAALVIFPIEENDSVRLIEILDGLLTATASAGAATAALGQPLRLGVGFHIGEVLYGNVGSKRRHDFTVMGPAVNLASRLEALTKSLGADLVISHLVAQSCRQTCGSPAEAAAALNATVQSLNDVRVRGVPDPMRVWTLVRRGAIASTSGIENARM